MVAPNVEVKEVTRNKIGKHSSVDEATATFEYDQPLVEWEARAEGSGVGQGLLVGGGQPLSDGYALHTKRLNEINGKLDSIESTYGSFLNLIAREQHSFLVENEELTGGDKNYRIDIYGKNDKGEWNPYVG